MLRDLGFVALLLLLSCSTRRGGDDITAGAGGTGASASGGSGGGSGGVSGAAGTGGSGGLTTPSDACPRVTLSNQLPVYHVGNTSLAVNLAESQRLEWGDAPDDTLLFTAVSSGMYTISMSDDPSMEGACGASIQEYSDVGTTAYYDVTWCPAPGSVAELDGVYAAGEGFSTEFPLEAGQRILIWVSCATWGQVTSGAYALSLQQLP